MPMRCFCKVSGRERRMLSPHCLRYPVQFVDTEPGGDTVGQNTFDGAHIKRDEGRHWQTCSLGGAAVGPF